MQVPQHFLTLLDFKLKVGFTFFGTFIAWYGLCIVFGIGCAFIIGIILCKKTKNSTDDFLILSAYLIGFGFFGAKLLYILISLKDINWRIAFSSLENFRLFFESGFVFYGGILGGIFGLIFVKKVHKIEISSFYNIITPCIALSHAFGRIGCSFAGCCYGKPTDSDFCFIYTKSFIAPNNVKLIPIQGIEAFFLFVFFILFTFIAIRKIKINSAKLYITLYSILRFTLEFFRGDEYRGKIIGLSTSQIISIFLLLSATLHSLFFQLLINKNRNSDQHSRA